MALHAATTNCHREASNDNCHREVPNDNCHREVSNDDCHREVSNDNCHREVSNDDCHREVSNDDCHREVSNDNCHREVSNDDCHREVSNDPELVEGHYQLVAPIMEQLFGPIPIIWTTYPDDPTQPKTFHQKFFGHYSHLSALQVQHLASIGAREFYSWFPTPEDESRARFIRFLLEESAGVGSVMIKEAALGLRDLLSNNGYETIPVLDGEGDVALFLPIAGAPSFPDVRLWCHRIARKAMDRYPKLFSEAPDVQSDGRVHIHVSSNAQGRFSILPCQLAFHQRPRRDADPLGGTREYRSVRNRYGRFCGAFANRG